MCLDALQTLVAWRVPKRFVVLHSIHHIAREEERDRERERDRTRARQRDRATERETLRDTEIETDTDTERESDRERERERKLLSYSSEADNLQAIDVKRKHPSAC